MKSSLRMLLPALLTAFCACGGDSTDNPDPDPAPGPPTPPLTEDTIDFPDGTTPAPLFSDAGGEVTLTFTATGPWTAAIRDAAADRGAGGGGRTVAGGTTIGAGGTYGSGRMTAAGGTSGSGGNSENSGNGRNGRINTVRHDGADRIDRTGTIGRTAAAGGSDKTGLSGQTRAAVDWLAVSPASGEAGTAAVVLTARPNESAEDRTAVVVLATGSAEQTLTVTQMRRGALVAAPDSFTVDNAGGEVTIEVNTNLDFDIAIGAGWIVQAETRALRTETLRFRVAENTGYDNRMGTITFTARDGTLTQKVKIYQAQKDALVVSPTDRVFDGEGRTFEIEVRANVEFTVENPDVEWLRSVGTRALKTHTLRYRLDENTTGDSRSDEIRIVDTKRNLSQTVTVTQLQNDALVAAKSGYTLPQKGGEITVELGRNVDFEIEIAQPWIARVATRGLVTEYLRFRIAENPGGENRTGVIAFVSKDRKIRQEVRIEQEGLDAAKEAVVRAFLVKLYNDTDGPRWRNRTNWCSDKPIDEWAGVTYEGGKLSLDLRSGWNDTNNTVIANNLRGAADLSGCEALVRLDCWGSYELTSLDVTGCTSLEYLNCALSGLKNLSVTGCGALQELLCSGNALTGLDLSSNRALRTLNCYDNYLTGLDVSGCKKLENLQCGENRTMTTLHASGCAALETLDCSYDQELSEMDITGCVKLRNLLFKVTKLTELDVSHCADLETVSCYGSQLYTLDVSGLKKLASVDCNTSRQLTSLDASGCSALTRLNCDCSNYYAPARGKLTSLDLSGCSGLASLSCGGNQLTRLDLSDCTAMTQLGCTTNQLESLDITRCPALTHLSCSHNRLKVLNLSACTALTELRCEENQLRSLDITPCPALNYLYCRSNPISQQITERYEQLESFFHDRRFEYYRNANGVWVYKDKIYGWWRPGEPESVLKEKESGN